jgi:hypothetical protein
LAQCLGSRNNRILPCLSTIEKIENKKKIFNEKLADYMIFLTENEYDKLFITYIKSNKIRTLEIQNLEYRKEYYNFYIRQDEGLLTTYEKLIGKLDLGKNNYFENRRASFLLRCHNSLR